MNAITWIHIAGGMVALVAGTVAVVARKGGGVHVSAGMWFCVSMFVRGVTGFVSNAWKTAIVRARDATV